MRHQSDRVPGKNYRLVAGRPLYAYILDTLSACPEIDRIVVDTDSPRIREGVEKEFPAVVLLERPEHLRAPDVSMNEVLRHDIEQAPAPTYLQTHSTNPLLRPQTISRAIRAFREGRDRLSLFSVTAVHVRLWAADGTPLNHDPTRLLRTQDLPPVYQENSCFYLFHRDTFLEHRNRLGRTPRLFEIDREEAWDVDEEIDLKIVESLIRTRAGL
jgi:CMP-N-acetylneuraminic acid synthetase